ncbi:hypothetical protein DN748_05985 [Sinomicrobium soli]|nr:hypothetical protein DN748_05985 [Sinomicrobium sp. N-1-3-6]
MIDLLLEKFRDNTITRMEYEQLARIVNDPENEGEIKYWMKEHWDDLDTEDTGSESWDMESSFGEELDRLREKIRSSNEGKGNNNKGR